jgi:hypothetical protein
VTLDGAMARWASLDEAQLARPWTWRDGEIDVRYAVYRMLEEAQEALMRATGVPHPESRRILSLAQRAFGDLRGLLVGLPAELLDRVPRNGDWPVREVLRHILAVERRYALQTEYAIERRDADPVRIPDDRLPTAAQMDVSGDAGAILGRIGEARAETSRRLGNVRPEAMTRPTTWINYSVDVRFRLHRFAAHVVEHTIQCEKALATLGWRESEGRRIVRRLWSIVGELEGLGAADELSALDALAADRLRSVMSD